MIYKDQIALALSWPINLLDFAGERSAKTLNFFIMSNTSSDIYSIYDSGHSFAKILRHFEN